MTIWFSQLLAAVTKEVRLIVRDREALAILFIMPAIFVLIMSLALQDAFKEQGGGVQFSMLIVDKDNDETGTGLVEAFTNSKAFAVSTDKSLDKTTLEQKIKAGQFHWIISNMISCGPASRIHGFILRSIVRRKAVRPCGPNHTLVKI